MADEVPNGWVTRRIDQMRDTVNYLSSAQTVPELLSQLMTRVREVLGADVAAVVVLDDNREGQYVAVLDDDNLWPELPSLLTAADPFRSVAGLDLPVRLADVRPQLEWATKSGEKLAIAPMVAAPARLAGHSIGALFGLRRAGAAEFTELDELSCVTLGLQAAAHVSNQRAREHAGRAALLEERGRIASELHGGIAELLRGSAQQVRDLTEEALLPAGVREQLAVVGAQLTSLAVGVDDYAGALGGVLPPGDMDLGRELAFALRELVPRGIDTVLQVDLGDGFYPSTRIAEDLLFLAREAITNSVRHASATRLAIDVRRTAEGVALAIQDNGVGIDPNQLRPGLGLKALESRIEHIGGEMKLIGIPGMGTLIHVRVPVADAVAAG